MRENDAEAAQDRHGRAQPSAADGTAGPRPASNRTSDSGPIPDRLGLDTLVTALKAAAEPTRLRILMLLRAHEFNVKDLTQILGQSQPRLSRHLKLLCEAGLLERAREGSWVYFHVNERTDAGRLTHDMLSSTNPDDPVFVRDRERASALRRQREAVTQEYFEQHAGSWDSIRALHVSQDEVEAAMQKALDEGPFETLVDLGTGTGRMLEVYAGRYRYGLGIDVNHAMLNYARSKIEAAGLRGAHVRQGDIYNLTLDDASADAVVVHQVLHYLSAPADAIAEAARIIKPNGRLLVVDFAPHDLEFLRAQHAHERLGISDAQMNEWLEDAGLALNRTIALEPKPTDTDKTITVTLWLATRPSPAPARASRDAAIATQPPPT